MVRLKGVILQLCLLVLSMSVNREDFKTCDQSAFCKRHRAIQTSTGYEIVADSIRQKGSHVEGLLKNHENTLALRIFGLADSTIRIQIDEPEGALRKRFIPTVALDGEPQTKEIYSVQQLDGHTIIRPSEKSNSRVVLQHSPFRVDVYNGHDELVIQVNKNGKLKVEEFRAKEDGKEYPAGFWEEHFKSYRDSKPFGSSSVGVDVSLVGFKHAFGLPEHADSFALRDTVGHSDPYRLYNLDVFEYELHNPMSLYVAVPYIVGHRVGQTVGVLWLNSAETWIDTSSTPTGLIRSVFNNVLPTEPIPYFDAHFMSETGLADLFVFLGPSPSDVQRQYSFLTGKTPLPPMFSLAYHQCRWNYDSEQDVLDVNAKFDEHDIPVDVIWLDIEHTDGKKYFTWGGSFPNPKKMIEQVAEKGRKMVTIVDPHIKADDGYNVYKDAKDLGLFVKKAGGSEDFEGHCWPGRSRYLDFLHPETRKYWSEQFLFDRYAGSTSDLFTWNDMNEPSVFSGPEVTMDKDCLHYGGIEHREVHNLYGLLYHSATFDGQMQRTNGRDRPFILTRSGFVGSQRTAAIWTGDNRADWGHLAISAPMLLSLSVAGNVFVGSDVGGFFGNPDEQLLTRWYQAGAFQPFFRAHAHIDSKRREPWLFSEQTRLAIREAIRRRYKLLPFWYTLFHEHSLTGAPPMRPIWYEFPEDESLFAEENEWMLGNALLVRPVVEKDATSASVAFPTDNSTRWYDWETGREMQKRKETVDAPINAIPVYQKGGSIVPTWQRVRRSSKGMLDDPLVLFVALDRRLMAKGKFYIDDGTTHDYKQGMFAAANFEYKAISARLSTISGQPTGGGVYDAKNWIEKIVVRGVRVRPLSISIIRASDPSEELTFSFEQANGILTIRKPNIVITQSFKINVRF